MTHFNEYNRIIEFRKQNPLPKDQYGENHHIVPKSICPLLEKAKENIVRLSAYEHFMAHYHLWLAFRDELKEKKWARSMNFALRLMKKTLMHCSNIEQLAKIYEEARIEFAKYNSEINKGKKRSIETRRKISKANKNPSEEIRTKIRERQTGQTNSFYGKHHSEETKKKMSESSKNISDETRRKMSESHRNCSEETRLRRSKSGIGRHWYNNGSECVWAKECPEGFVPGRLRFNKRVESEV